MDAMKVINNLLKNISDEIKSEFQSHLESMNDRGVLRSSITIELGLHKVSSILKNELEKLYEGIPRLNLSDEELEVVRTGLIEFTDIQIQKCLDRCSQLKLLESMSRNYDEYISERKESVYTIIEYHALMLTQSRRNERSKGQMNTFNLHGNNSRVNINSNDYSNNVVNAEEVKVFEEIRQAVRANVEDSEKQNELMAAVDQMEQTKGTSGFVEGYKRFMANLSDHITVLGAFIPILSQWLK